MYSILGLVFLLFFLTLSAFFHRPSPIYQSLLCIYIYLNIYLSIYTYVYHSFLPNYLHLSYLSTYLFIYIYFYIYFYDYLPISIYLSIYRREPQGGASANTWFISMTVINYISNYTIILYIWLIDWLIQLNFAWWG